MTYLEMTIYKQIFTDTVGTYNTQVYLSYFVLQILKLVIELDIRYLQDY